MSLKYITGESTEGLPLSDAVVAGDFVFVSGICGFDLKGAIVSGGVGEETRQIFTILTSILQEVGASYANLTKVSAHLISASDFDEFNKVYREIMVGQKPARITVCSGMTIEASIEMDFIAYLGK